MKVAAIVPAAGTGRRLKSKIDKPYIQLCGKPIIAHTLLRLSANRHIKEIIVAVKKERLTAFRRDIIKRFRIKKARVVIGGRERIDSVYSALREASKDIDYILIHDGIRPFITHSLIDSSLKAAKKSGASVVAVRVKPTLKYVGKTDYVQNTPDRRDYWEAQTPQVFKRDLIEKAYRKLKKKTHITDDAMLVERIGVKPKIVLGSYSNIKITTKEDLGLAKIFCREAL
ncbi:2-C-methyl-D-erythritol 4-phosphate cytidylyltransferase [Candidatus Omnitrophota bacterium]